MKMYVWTETERIKNMREVESWRLVTCWSLYSIHTSSLRPLFVFHKSHTHTHTNVPSTPSPSLTPSSLIRPLQSVSVALKATRSSVRSNLNLIQLTTRGVCSEGGRSFFSPSPLSPILSFYHGYPLMGSLSSLRPAETRENTLGHTTLHRTCATAQYSCRICLFIVLTVCFKR